MTTVHHVREREGVEDGVYIGRGGPWGNPYKIGEHGTREQVIEKYRQHLWERIKLGEVTLPSLARLDGQRLFCYCAPRPCHGDVLARAAAWATDELEASRHG